MSPKKKDQKKKVTKKVAPKKKTQVKKPADKKTPAKQSASPVQKRTRKTPQLVRGMKDITPPYSDLWMKAYHACEGIATAYNFEYFSTPILEEASLFQRSLGKSSDVVSKEMYVFEDKDGSKLALRPEMTASTARSYITQGMLNRSQPVKLWYFGPMFRHDRPQAGRYRQFHQFGCETLGVHDPAIDAELITISYNLLRDLGIEANVHINSIGTPEDREQYVVELVGYLRSKRSYLSDESRKRITRNPLRVLDSKDPQDKEVVEEAPQIVDWLSEKSKNYFMSVLEYLDEADVPYVLKPTLVRGLDYYTDTVFELFDTEQEESSQNALGAGGRYNRLVEQLGGQETPGAGFSMGIERILFNLESKRKRAQEIAQQEGDDAVVEQEPNGPEVFFAHLGENARKRSLRLIEELRREGIAIKHNLGKASLKGQLELADKFGASHSIILGQKELQDDTIIVRDMSSGIQEIIDQKKLKKEIEKILGSK